MQHLSRVRGQEVASKASPLLIRLSLLFLSFFALTSSASAGTVYYLSTSGSDTNPGTASQPWQTFAKAWTVLAPGDTLLVKDGRYLQSINPRISGTSGSPITIKAENDGGAILDGEGARSGIEIVSSSSTVVQHITVEGFRVEDPGERPAVWVSSPDGTPVNAQTNHIVIRRTGARGGAVRTNNAVWEISRTRDSMLEDVWGWGAGRYVLNVYGATRITVRRGVFRWDRWGEGASAPSNPKFNMAVYDTHDSLFENILLLDAAADPYGGDKGGLYVPGNANGSTAPYGDSDDNTFRGVISLNNIGVGVGVEGGSGGANDNNVFVDLVSWGNSDVGVTVPRSASGTRFDHVTLGDNKGGTYFANGNGVSGTALRSSLVYDNTNIGVNGPASTSYNNVFGNGTNYSGASPGPESFSLDPLLDFILCIGDGSPNKGTAADGGDRGATVVNRSVDGLPTAQALWPWPHQDRIQADLCETESRGFCGWASLSDYVWGQLGNPPPPSWSCSPDAPPPPSCLRATYPSPRLQNQGFPSQSGIFTAEVDVTPSAAGIDAAVALSSGPQTHWDGLAATVLFYLDGTIKARNGGVYAGTVPYGAGTTYRVRMAVDVASHTYSAWVTPAGGSEQVIGTGLAFRDGLETVTVLDHWTLIAEAGSLTACGFTISTEPSQPPTPREVTFQQGLDGYAGVADTWINSYDPGLNFNGETKLAIYGTEDIKTLVRFDLSSIPAGATISSATLSLYNYAHSSSANGGTLSVYPVHRPWVESQATWNVSSTGNPWAAAGMQSGTDYAASPTASITIDTAVGLWRSFGVTAAVQGWVDGTLPNQGFVVRSPTRGAKPLFYSSSYVVDPTLRPKLTVVYR